MNVFEEGLRLAALAEGGPCSTSEADTMTPEASASGNHAVVAQLLRLLDAKQEHSELQALAGKQRDHMAAAGMVDARVMQSTSTSLAHANAALHRVVAERSVLALRLKDLNSKQTIGIEPQLQPQFSALLAEAARGAGRLDSALPSLQWAAQCSQHPTSWEQHLQPLSSAIAECSTYHMQLEARAASLSKYAAMLSSSSEASDAAAATMHVGSHS